MFNFKTHSRTMLLCSATATVLALGPAIANSAEPAPNTPQLHQLANSKVYVSMLGTEMLPIDDAPTGQGNNGHIPLGSPEDEESPLTFYAAKKVFDAVEDVAELIEETDMLSGCEPPPTRRPLKANESPFTML